MTMPSVQGDPDLKNYYGGYCLVCWMDVREIYFLFRQRLMSILVHEPKLPNGFIGLLADDFFDHGLMTLNSITNSALHPCWYPKVYPNNLYPEEFRYEHMEMLYQDIMDMDLNRYYAPGLQHYSEEIAFAVMNVVDQVMTQSEHVLPYYHAGVMSFFWIEYARYHNLYDVKMTMEHPGPLDERVIDNSLEYE